VKEERGSMSITARNSGYNIVDMRSGRGIVFDNINSWDAKRKEADRR
jgi:hypothetical protein